MEWMIAAGLFTVFAVAAWIGRYAVRGYIEVSPREQGKMLFQWISRLGLVGIMGIVLAVALGSAVAPEVGFGLVVISMLVMVLGPGVAVLIELCLAGRAAFRGRLLKRQLFPKAIQARIGAVHVPRRTLRNRGQKPARRISFERLLDGRERHSLVPCVAAPELFFYTHAAAPFDVNEVAFGEELLPEA